MCVARRHNIACARPSTNSPLCTRRETMLDGIRWHKRLGVEGRATLHKWHQRLEEGAAVEELMYEAVAAVSAAVMVVVAKVMEVVAKVMEVVAQLAEATAALAVAAQAEVNALFKLPAAMLAISLCVSILLGRWMLRKHSSSVSSDVLQEKKPIAEQVSQAALKLLEHPDPDCEGETGLRMAAPPPPLAHSHPAPLEGEPKPQQATEEEAPVQRQQPAVDEKVALEAANKSTAPVAETEEEARAAKAETDRQSWVLKAQANKGRSWVLKAQAHKANKAEAEAETRVDTEVRADKAEADRRSWILKAQAARTEAEAEAAAWAAAAWAAAAEVAAEKAAAETAAAEKAAAE